MGISVLVYLVFIDGIELKLYITNPNIYRERSCPMNKYNYHISRIDGYSSKNYLIVANYTSEIPINPHFSSENSYRCHIFFVKKSYIPIFCVESGWAPF